MIPLFNKYPLLKQKLPYTALGEHPTPAQELKSLGKTIGINRLFVKRDDIINKVYGGNKVRKLEFILGKALNLKKDVLTYGSIGSNHVLATAIFSQQMGLKCISILIPQSNKINARPKLLLYHLFGSELHLYPVKNRYLAEIISVYQILKHKFKHGNSPLVVPFGGSSPLGTLGYVNAAFELANQIKRGIIPEPDFIYVPMGSMGTAAGLVLGIKATGLKTKVVPVRIIERKYSNERKLKRLLRKTNILLNSLDPSFPMFDILNEDISVRHNSPQTGSIDWFRDISKELSIKKDANGIQLKTTYMNRTIAVLIEDVRNKILENKVILLWNTNNSRDYTKYIEDINLSDLPRQLHHFFPNYQ
ncbi:pyridoxal-phosphate dependent enzyme [candidate division WOR-3 bacterium]|uniref:Pyridoxal-phosphate dependent enzyme n=1 Tax=candidate division WOR-3 bacterium TaxID=2052148 RepID=A0A9D5KAQ8_UNCW3|nr:pyridoxal-phosphate dependent enzyme [candidate division WOR-3 bacterium]MBD3364371.1 pyridoxal-phosphate dependent enzyme [candidate division WOR-3 bacterium]